MYYNCLYFVVHKIGFYPCEATEATFWFCDLYSGVVRTMFISLWGNHPQCTTTQALPNQHAVGLTLLGNVNAIGLRVNISNVIKSRKVKWGMHVVYACDRWEIHIMYSVQIYGKWIKGLRIIFYGPSAVIEYILIIFQSFLCNA
jgi:hypothetical protein